MGTSTARDVLVLALREPSPARVRALHRALAQAQRPDWQRIGDLAAIHGVLPFLAAVARLAPLADAMPTPLKRALETRAAAVTLKAGALTHSLGAVLESLQRRGIEPLVLKGPALAAMLYPDPALRPFNDLDVLCPAHQLDVATDVLRAEGYVPCPQGATAQDGFHIQFRAASSLAIVELHTDLLQLGLPTRCLPALWDHPQPVTIRGVRALALAPEHQVLHLCVHLHTHGYSRLIWFKDLDLLLRRYGQAMDWALVGAMARDEGVATSVRHTLALLTALLDTPLPASVLSGLPRDPLGELAHAVLWPRRAVLSLHSKQRLRSVRFNPRLGFMGVCPSLIVMGRRAEKLSILLGRRAAATHGPPRASQPNRDLPATEAEHSLATLAVSGSASSVLDHPVQVPTSAAVGPSAARALPASRGAPPIMGE